MHELLNSEKRKPREWVSGYTEFYGKKFSHSHINKVRRCTGTRSCGIYTVGAMRHGHVNDWEGKNDHKHTLLRQKRLCLSYTIQKMHLA